MHFGRRFLVQSDLKVIQSVFKVYLSFISLLVMSSSCCDSPTDRQVALSASSRLSAAAAGEEEAEPLKRERVFFFLHVRAVCLFGCLVCLFFIVRRFSCRVL